MNCFSDHLAVGVGAAADNFVTFQNRQSDKYAHAQVHGGMNLGKA